MKKLVVDTSIIVKWLIPEEREEEARALRVHDVHAPSFVGVELINVLLSKVRARELLPEQAQRAVCGYAEGPLRLHDATPLLSPAFELGLTLRYAGYDCLFLALAILLDCEFVTADARFVRAAAGTPYAKYVRLLGTP